MKVIDLTASDSSDSSDSIVFNSEMSACSKDFTFVEIEEGDDGTGVLKELTERGLDNVVLVEFDSYTRDRKSIKRSFINFTLTFEDRARLDLDDVKAINDAETILFYSTAPAGKAYRILRGNTLFVDVGKDEIEYGYAGSFGTKLKSHLIDIDGDGAFFPCWFESAARRHRERDERLRKSKIEVIDLTVADMVINPNLDSPDWYTFVCVDRHEDVASLMKEIGEFDKCGLKNVVLVEIDQVRTWVDWRLEDVEGKAPVCTLDERAELEVDDERAILFYSTAKGGNAYRLMCEEKFDFSRADDRPDLDTMYSHKMTKSGIFATANEFALATS